MEKSPLKQFRSQIFAILLILAASFSSIIAQNQVQAQTNLNPEISNVTPNTLRTEGGIEVTITGKNFSSDTVVVLGGSLIKNPTLTSSSEIRFQVPPQAIAGAKTLTVLNNKGIAQKELRVIDKSVSGLSVGEITTIAGGEATTGNGELATKANINSQSLAYDREGNLFIMEANQIRRIDAKTGTINTVVGLGSSTKEGDLALLAKIEPNGIAIASDGAIFIADRLTKTVKRVDALTKTIKTFAGGKPGTASGDGGLATEASLGGGVTDIALDQNNNLFLIAGDFDNLTVRKVDSKTGIITAFAGNGQGSFSGDGGLAINAGITPQKIALDSLGNLFISDFSNTRIRRVDASTGIITTVAGNGGNSGSFFDPIDGKPATSVGIVPNNLALDKENNFVFSDVRGLLKVDTKTGLIKRLPVTSLIPTDEAGGGFGLFGVSGGFTFNSDNNLVFNYDGIVFEILSSSPTGENRKLAGIRTNNFSEDGSPAITSNLGGITSAVSNISGDIFINDLNNKYVRKIDSNSGLITTIAGGGPKSVFSPHAGDGKNANSPEVAFYPASIALDFLGNLYVGDFFNENVRRVDTFSNIITTFAGNSDDEGSTGDGGQAKNAGLGNVNDVAFDPQGNLFICADFSIRRVDANSKIITTIAGNGKRNFAGDGGLATNATGGFIDLTIGSGGNIFVVDSELSNTGKDRVRRIDTRTGIITTVAGGNNTTFTGENGPATKAGLGNISSIVVNSSGDLFISSYRVIPSNAVFAFPTIESRIWRVEAKTGNISVLASSPTDTSVTTSASVKSVSQLSLDKNENLLVTEGGSNISAVRLLKLSDKVKTSSDVFISNVNYQKPTLTVKGGGFGNSGVTVTINGQNVTKQMANQTNDQLTLTGKTKQLNLRKTGNQIIVTTSTGINTSLVFQ